MGQRNGAIAVTTAPVSLAEAVTSNGIRSVLVLLSRFSRYAGPSLIAVDIAGALAPLGVTVTVAALGTTGAFSGSFECVAEVIDLRRDPGPLLSRRFDVVLTQAWSPACFGLLECAVRYRYLVLGSFSGLTAGEAILGLEDEADVLLFHSARNLQLQAPSLPGAAAPMLVYGNAVPSCWFEDVPPPPGALRRIAVISNHVPEELREAAHALEGNGIRVDVIGSDDEPRLVTPALVDDYDCIVSIGHTAQKAMARQRPYYCYDHFGGPGYITPLNVEDERTICFSGRSDRRKKSGREIAGELMRDFDAVVASSGQLREIVERDHRLETVLACILTAGIPSEPRTCRTPRNRNLRKIFQHSFAQAETTPFVRNIGFDYEAAPVLLHSRATRLDGELAERLTVTRLPPYIFGSMEPSPLAIGLQIVFRPGVTDAEIVVDHGGAEGRDGASGDAVITSSSGRVSKQRQHCTVGVTLLVGVEPMAVTLSARLGEAIVPLLSLGFETAPSGTVVARAGEG